MNRLSLSIVLLFLLILLLNSQSWFGDTQKETSSDAEEVWQPNYLAEGMTSTLYNKFGQVNHKVFAEQMEHYEMLGFTLFKSPQYTIYIKDQPQPWHVTALEGTLYENNRIQLETDVEITSMDDEGFVRRITTNFIEIDLEAKTMMSDQAVNIMGKDFTINSNGFTADLETQKFELLNHVQTLYSQNANR